MAGEAVTVAELVAQAKRHGATFTVDGEHIEIAAPAPLPTELVEALRQHKAELMALLEAHGGKPPKPWCLTYGERPSREAREAELVEIGRRLREYGYVLLWANVVEDLVAFYRDEDALKKISPGFVLYSEAELLELRKADPSDEERRTIYLAKKLGGIIKEITSDGQL